MNPNDFDRQCPDFAGGFKFAAALVVIGLIIAASESSINWLPTTTLHDVAANEATAAAIESVPSASTPNAVEPSPHIEAF